MNKIGIRAHDIGQFDPKTLASHVKQFGFDGVQLVFKKAILGPVPIERMTEIREAFQGLDLMMLGAYFNPVHPDLKVVNEGIETFKQTLHMASILRSDSVGSETGSLMGNPWNYVPENHTVTALNRVIEVFKGIVSTAEQTGSMMVIEGAYAHVAYDPKRVRAILDALKSNHVKVTVDLYNFLNINNHQDHLSILREAIALMKDDIMIFHLKDYVEERDQLKQVGLGQGLMKYPEIISMIQQHCPSAHLIFEGVTGEDIQTSLHYIKKLIERK
jgi:sugar phosphate isomerase/epimerase